MKKIDVSQALAILANAGVIAGIIFLALELRQNNSLLEAQTSFARFSVERERRTRLIENRAGLLEATLKARSGEELTRIEQAQLTAHRLDILDSWLWQYRESLEGRLDPNLIDLDNWRFLWRRDEGMQNVYHGVFARRNADFDRYMEENVINVSE